MPQIKFSHLYKKLIDTDGNTINTAKLLLVSVVPLDDISIAKDFLHYDTDDVFSLSYSEFYLLLIFLRPDGEIFTTVRPRYAGKSTEKEQYYRGLIGQDFDIIING